MKNETNSILLYEYMQKNNSDNVTKYLTFHCMIKFQKCHTCAFLGQIIVNLFGKTKLTSKETICLIENS